MGHGISTGGREKAYHNNPPPQNKSGPNFSKEPPNAGNTEQLYMWEYCEKLTSKNCEKRICHPILSNNHQKYMHATTPRLYFPNIVST
jgi:hypothetical protein